jgi:hypothetical protein
LLKFVDSASGFHTSVEVVSAPPDCLALRHVQSDHRTS